MTDDDVRFLYRELLDREPESQATIDRWRDVGWRDVLSIVLHSDERKNLVFREMARRTGLATPIYLPTKYGFLMPISPSEPDTFLAYKDSAYETAESAFIYANTQPGDRCIDLGARHGWFTGIMAARAGAAGRVYSFEPLPPAAGGQEVAAVNKFTWVVFFRLAASNTRGVISFDAISLSMAGGGNAKVQTCILDDLLMTRETPINVMKIDIEGAEFLALDGAKGILSNDKPILMIELYDDLLRRVSGSSGVSLVDFLRKFSYAPYTLGGERLDRGVIAGRLATGEIMNVAMWPAGHPRHP